MEKYKHNHEWQPLGTVVMGQVIYIIAYCGLQECGNYTIQEIKYFSDEL